MFFKQITDLQTQVYSLKKTEQLLKDHISSIAVKLSDQKSLIPELERLKSDNSSLKSKLLEAGALRTQVMQLRESVESQEEEIQRWRSKSQSLESEVDFMRKQKNEILATTTSSKEQAEKMNMALVDEYKRANTNLSIRIQELESLLIQNENKRVDLRKTLERQAIAESERYFLLIQQARGRGVEVEGRSARGR